MDTMAATEVVTTVIIRGRSRIMESPRPVNRCVNGLVAVILLVSLFEQEITEGAEEELSVPSAASC